MDNENRQLSDGALIASVMTVANLLILGLTLKLYTEYFKAESITKRSEAGKKNA